MDKRYSRFSFGALAAGALLASMVTGWSNLALAAGAEEVQDFTIDLKVGESYLIRKVLPEYKPKLSFEGKQNCFHLENSSARSLKVVASEECKGTVQVEFLAGTALYHVTVRPAAGNVASSKPINVVETKPPISTAVPAGFDPTAPVTPVMAHQGDTSATQTIKYAANPRAVGTTDAMEREPALDGRHYLPGDAISMMVGTSRIYDFPYNVRRVAVADTRVADIQVVNPRQLMLVGHQSGFTTLAVWDHDGRYQERQVRIEKEGHQQVLLNVTVAEVNRSRLESEGIDYSVGLSDLGISLAGLPGNVASSYSSTANLNTSGSGGSSNGGIAPPGGNPFPLLLSNQITYALTAQNNRVSTNTFFQFLESHSLGRILAQPRLLANSGEEAKFLSGGEIPIIIAQALNTSVVFKQFGTSVMFLPTVVGKHEIELVVKPEVSKPDFSQGVQLFGFTVPAFVTRRAETDVRMHDNQTLIIAGLILDDITSKVRKVPYLGDLPYAGALFRSTSYDNEKTELVISVTPEIVAPIPENAGVEMPTDRGPLQRDEIRTGHLTQSDVSRPRLY